MEEVSLDLIHELMLGKNLKPVPDEPLDRFFRRAGVLVMKNRFTNSVELTVMDKVGDDEPYTSAKSEVPYDEFKMGQLKLGDDLVTIEEIWATFYSAKSLAGLNSVEVVAVWLNAIRLRGPIATVGLEKDSLLSLRENYAANIEEGPKTQINSLKIGETTICFGPTGQMIAKYQKPVLEGADRLFAYAWEQPRKLYRKEGRKLTVVQKLSSPDVVELLTGEWAVAGSTSRQQTNGNDQRLGGVGGPVAILPVTKIASPETHTSAVDDKDQNANRPNGEVHHTLATSIIDLRFTKKTIMALPAGTYLISSAMEGAYADRSNGTISVGPSWIAAIPATKEARLAQWGSIVERGLNRTDIDKAINPGDLHEDWKQFLSKVRYLGTYREWAVAIHSGRKVPI